MHARTELSAGFLPGSAQRRLFHLIEAPRGRAPERAVLFVPPFAEELNKSRRMVALQSRALAEAGCVTLRVDPSGCGDSEGELDEVSWEDWIEDLQAAAEALRRRCDGPLWLWGLRSGAVLASHLSARVQPVQGWLMWQPLLGAQTAVQQLLRLLTAGELAAADRRSMADLRRALEAGETLEAAGYPIAARLYQSMSSAQLLAPPAGAEVHWIEVSSRPEATLLPASDARVRQWQESGCRVHPRLVAGPAFWQTTEIEVAPELIAASLAALSLAATAPSA